MARTMGVVAGLLFLLCGHVLASGQGGAQNKGNEGGTAEYIEAYTRAEEEKLANGGAVSRETQNWLDKMTKAMNDRGYTTQELENMMHGRSRRSSPEGSEQPTDVSRDRQKRVYVSARHYRWDKQTIPFKYTDSYTDSLRMEAERSMRTFERVTCMRFVPWENNTGTTTNMALGLNHLGHLKYRVDKDCNSLLGNMGYPNGQGINCCSGFACLHELGHAMGFHHEQKSPDPDRNWLIRVNYDNIKDGDWHVWTQASASTYTSLGYDMSNYMHYLNWMFAKKTPAFTPLFPELKVENGIYYLAHEISVSHNCRQDHCANVSTVCENEGYMDKIDYKCQCRCLPGLDPDTGCTSSISNSTSTQGFPGGQFALPAPKSGCPVPDSTAGVRVHYTDGGNTASSGYGLKGSITDTKVEENFCVTKSQANGVKWPAGNYCIYRVGGKCPEGFQTGFAQYDDKSGSQNSVSGDLPDGVYGNNTRLEYCCMTTGFSWEEIFLPNHQPLVLIKHPQESCQKIRGMHYYVETHTIRNTAVEGIHATGGNSPITKSNGDKDFKTSFCHYKPAMLDCGGVYELNGANPSVTVQSPNAAELECFWYFKAPKGDNLLLKFEEFNVEGTMGNCKDQVELRYYHAGQDGFTYCGPSLHRSFQSINNTFHIRMSTFSGNTNSKIKATVSYINKNDLCYAKEDRGTTYVGKTSFTRNFEPCLPWKDMSHCEHNFGVKKDFGNMLLEGNYCRNPDYATGIRPWCYTNAYGCERNYCDPCLLGTLYDTNHRCAELAAGGFCKNGARDDVMRLCARTCGADLDLIRPIKPVTQVSCPTPGPISDGALLDPSPPSSYAVGAAAVYKSSTGNNTKKRYCLSDGTWSALKRVSTICDDGWQFKLFNGEKMCFQFQNQEVILSEARKICASLNAIIPNPKSKEDNDFLKSIMPYYSWIDLTDSAKEGTWVWGDGSALVYSNWASGQPDQSNAAVDCTYMRTNGYWYDDLCDTYKYRFSCGKSAKALPCIDEEGRCEAVLKEDPTLCKKHADFAGLQCAYSCGICKTDNTPKCSVPSIPNTLVENSVTSISLGQTVTYKCKNGTIAYSGYPERICLASGQLGGAPLQCVPECQEGWSYLEETKSCYKHFPQLRTYAEAVTKCASLGGLPAMPKTTTQKDNYYRLCYKSSWPWIGLTDLEIETVFKWADGTYLLGWTHWGGGEPNGGTRENCASNVWWNDIRCGDKLTTLCETKLPDFPPCADFNDNCEASATANATFCVDNYVDCKYTCGKCDLDKTPQCPVPTLANAVVAGGPSSVSRGVIVDFSCTAGYAVLTGNVQRICLASGQLSGVDVQCVLDQNCMAPTVKNAEVVGGYTTTSIGKNLTYTCKNGTIEVGGNAERTCWTGGKFAGDDIICMETCPTGWTFFDETKSCYKFYPKASLTYADAVTKCAKYNGVNVMPKTSTQFSHVYKLAEKIGSWPWYGLTDIETEGTFKWADNDSLTFTHWGRYEPNNGGGSEDCTRDYWWNDLGCDYKHTVMCQSKLITFPACADYIDECVSSALANPHYCTDSSNITDVECRYTCGKCDQNKTPACPVPTLDNTQVVGGKTSVARGETVQFKCNSGHLQLSGSVDRICLASGSLSGQDIKCVLDQKCTVPTLQNAVTDGGQSSLTINEKVVFSCKNGTEEISGDGTRTCEEGGKLTGQDLQCIPTCLTDWTFLDETKSCYRLYPKDSMTYAEASAKCARFNGHNVMTKTSTQLTFLQKIADTAGAWPWFGLTDIETEGTFKWADNDPLTYAHWSGSEPNNWDNSEDCVIRYWWNDISCDNKYPVMCQAKLINYPACVDQNDDCEAQVKADAAYCTNNVAIADTNCRKTCAKCT